MIKMERGILIIMKGKILVMFLLIVTQMNSSPIMGEEIQTDNIFDQDKDRIGIGYTWADPADRKLDDQSVIDAYYRVQLTPEIQIGPTLEIIFDPVRNQEENTVTVLGFRARVVL